MSSSNGAEQQVTVEPDVARQVWRVSARGRFDLRPTVIEVPFAMVAFMFWQMLGSQIAPVIQAMQSATAPTDMSSAGPVAM